MDKKTLLDIAHLARLTVEEAQINNYCGQLNQILHFVEQMRELDTDAIEPLAHPLPDIYTSTLTLRADQVSELNQREQLQQCTTNVQDGFYVVPAVIE